MEISINQAFKLWDKYYVPITLRKHSLNVAKVVSFLTQKYLEKDLITKDDQIRIIISAILHDLMKPICKYVDFENAKILYNYTEDEIKFWNKLKEKYPDELHEDMAYEELKQDYPAIAKIIQKHGFLFDTEDKFLHDRLLAYSDLRADGNKILSIEKRVLNLHIRYKHLNKTIGDWLKVITQDEHLLKLEKEIFSKINIEPEDCDELNNVKLDKLFKDYNINKDQKVQG